MKADKPYRLFSLNGVQEDRALDVFEHHASALERHRRKAFGRAIERTRFAKAHGAMRIILADQMQQPLAQVTVRLSESGKPFIANGPYFSLSYEGEDAFLAVSAEKAIGLDVVALLPDGEWLDRIIAPELDIAAVIKAQPAALRPDLLVWAAKEAAAKLTEKVELAPEDWRLSYDAGLSVEAVGVAKSLIDLVPLDGSRAAAIARTDTKIEED